MRRYIFNLSIALLLALNGSAQSYGLLFNSHEVVQEKRTCLDITPDDSLCFSKNFELAFDIGFVPGRQIYFGYVLRIIRNNSENIDLIYNQPFQAFKVIIGDSFSGISFSVDSIRLHKEWNRFTLSFDLGAGTLQLVVNGKVIGKSAIPGTGKCFKFLWGANDYQKFKTRDIPPMRLRNIQISEGGEPQYLWKLNAATGDTCYDELHQRMAIVKNPVWLKPKFQQWQLISSFTLGGYASLAYDAHRDRLFVIGSDSLAVCTPRNEEQPLEWIPSKHQETILGHQSIYDTIGDRLYDIFIDRQLITTFDFGHHQWDKVMTYAPITEYWHANKFITPADSSLYIIGGYGQLRYKNIVQRYSFVTHKWERIKPQGDYLPPRYLSGLAMDLKGKYAYMIGGYGSQTGDQMLDPKNYYDLFRYDIKANSFKRLYGLKVLNTPFAFANSLVVGQNGDAWYGLIFPNDSYNSRLQLIEGSLKDSGYRPVANAIPYSFHDVQSYADLFYSPLTNRLIAVTLLYSREEDPAKTTTVRIYSLNFPPEVMDTAQNTIAVPKRTLLKYLIIAAVLLAAGAFFLLAYRKRKKADLGLLPSADQERQQTDLSILHPAGVGQPGPAAVMVKAPSASGTQQPALSQDASPSDLEPMENVTRSAIYLFGQFQVFDKDGQDITRLFTPLLKELFLIIVTYSIRNGRGISSEGLNEILWHDKSEKDAKNNRSVNLAKLKGILEKIGNCSVNKESAYWRLSMPGDDIYIDYKKYSALVAGPSDPGRLPALIAIIRRGGFLSQTEYNWLDDIKSAISNDVIDLCLGYIKEQQITRDPEFIIEIANCMFAFDPLNEDALIYKCKALILLKRHTLANNTYLKFAKEYKDIYGSDYERSFQDIFA